MHHTLQDTLDALAHAEKELAQAKEALREAQENQLAMKRSGAERHQHTTAEGDVARQGFQVRRLTDLVEESRAAYQAATPHKKALSEFDSAVAEAQKADAAFTEAAQKALDDLQRQLLGLQGKLGAPAAILDGLPTDVRRALGLETPPPLAWSGAHRVTSTEFLQRVLNIARARETAAALADNTVTTPNAGKRLPKGWEQVTRKWDPNSQQWRVTEHNP
jgi:hypothetical protein